MKVGGRGERGWLSEEEGRGDGGMKVGERGC